MTAATTPRRLVLVLGALSAFAPLSLDMYLPAFPELAEDLSASASQVQLTITACVIGLAAGQLIAGPLSDRFGRKRPLLIGVGAWALASVLCAIAPDITTLTAARVVQGLAGSAGIVIARAVARDLHSGPALARFFALLLLVNGVAPVLAPTLGAQVLHVTSWRGVFVVLAVLGALLWTATALVLQETLPPERRRPGGIRATLGTFRVLLSDRAFTGIALTSGLVFGTLFSYIAGSSFVLQEVYGFSEQQFALAFGANAVGLISAAQVSARLVGRLGPERILGWGLRGSLTGSLGLTAAVATDAGLVAVLLSLLVVVASVGLVAPNAAALALADHPEVAGSASALLGTSQYLLGGLLAPFVGLAGQASLAAVVLGCSVAATVVHRVLVTNR